MDGEPDLEQGREAAAAPESPPPIEGEGSVERVETAVSPVIRGDSVSIPTPAWGVALPEDVETVEAELVETGAQPELDESETEGVPGRRRSAIGRRWPGWLALLAAVATAIVTAAAVAVDARHDSVTATMLAWVAIGLSIAAFLGGVAAAVLGRGRVSGVVAAIVGIFADPWVLLQVLTLLRG